AYRVIADHIRTLTFALTDGATIGNVGRDYVLKRILRRAERYGYQVLGTNEPFLHSLVPTVVEHFGTAFPELKRDPQKVRDQIYDEEAAFLRTLRRGVILFADSAGCAIRRDISALHPGKEIRWQSSSVRGSLTGMSAEVLEGGKVVAGYQIPEPDKRLAY